ncbi:MAG: hypothetical protein QW531_05610 [Thermoplasmata archaeon]
MKEFGLSPEQVDNMRMDEIEIYIELLHSYYENEVKSIARRRI